MWFLENNILTEYQSGFRKNRSTTDQLIRLESYIREAFVRREHVVEWCNYLCSFQINNIDQGTQIKVVCYSSTSITNYAYLTLDSNLLLLI